MVACALFRGSSRRRRLTWILVATAATALPVLYGVWRTARVEARIESAPTVRVAILQPNIEQGLKWSPGARAETLRRVTGMIERGDRSGADFVLGPEAALPIIVSTGEDRLPDAVPAGSKPLLLGIVRGRGQPEEVVLPDGRRARRFVRHFNSAVLAGPDRRVLGAYDKQYLVAVTEQIPYRRVFGFFLPLLRKQFGRFDPGDSLEILQVPVGRRSVGVGATVCYESLFPVLSRRMVQDGAVLFANVTNDAWFGRSSMSYQHVGLLVLRAIENRRSVVRSANTGVSAWIDPAGRVRQRTRLDEAAMLVVDAPLLDGASIYCRVGDLTVYASYFAALWMLADCWRRHRRGITF